MNIQGFIKKEQMLTLWTLHTKGTCLFCPRTGPILRLITAIGSDNDKLVFIIYHDSIMIYTFSLPFPGGNQNCSNAQIWSKAMRRKKHHNESFFSELVSDRAFSLVYWIYCQHRQQQSLWFTLRTTTAGQGTWFRSPEGAVQKYGAYDFQKAKTKLHGSEWKTWTCNHFARVLPIMMQKVKLSARGVTMPENMSPWPIVGYSLPRVYPATHQSKKNVAIFK